MSSVTAALLIFIALMVGAVIVLRRSDEYVPSNDWRGLLHDAQFWIGFALMLGGSILLILQMCLCCR